MIGELFLAGAGGWKLRDSLVRRRAGFGLYPNQENTCFVTMETRLSVFLSGVINERTRPLRAIIKQHIEATGWASVWVFEKEPPHPNLRDSFLRKIDASDLYVLILWDDITNAVESEFARAKSAGIPVLVFRVRTESSSERLNSFWREISSDLKFATCDEGDLPSAVYEAVITNLIDSWRARLSRQAYIRDPWSATTNQELDLRPKPPLSEQEAALEASRVLPGRILRAIHFTDQEDGRSRLAVLAATTEQTRSFKAFLLGEFAGAYRIEWESEAELPGFPWCDPIAWFEAKDINTDGRAEVFYAGGSHGTGSGADTYYIYVPRAQRTFSVMVQETRDPYYREWVEPSPEILEPENSVLLNAIEARMAELKVLRTAATVPQSPDVLWYIDNGFLKTGPVTLRRFPGPPKFGASATVTHRDGNFEWHAFFKGPVIGHDLIADESFVIYGPTTMYRWPTCFASDEKYLWFGTNGEGVFQYDKVRQLLTQMPSHYLKETGGTIQDIELQGSKLVVNSEKEFEVPWK